MRTILPELRNVLTAGLLPLAALLLLAGCDRQPASVAAPVEKGGAGPSSGGAALEAAARERGAILSRADVSPVGLFQQEREHGADSLCVRPNGDRDYRFGLEMRFDAANGCGGHGDLRRVGKMLVLRFDESDCMVVADYDGDRIGLPGVVDRSCEAQCRGRATLAGMELPRISGDDAMAAAIRDADGALLCPKAG